jgi:predicted aspartyl protease
VRHSQWLFIIVFLALSSQANPITEPGDNLLPIRLDQGKRIILEGTVNNSTPVNMMLDTGSTCSVISTQLAKKLQLRKLLDNVPVYWSDQLVRHSLVVVPDIRIGPIHRPLTCPASDISLHGVDVIIGRDLLRTQIFTVDYEGRSLRFGAGVPLQHCVPFDVSRKEIIVSLRIGHREISLLLDSGADKLYLFENKVYPWLRINPRRLGCSLRHISTGRRGMMVSLTNVSLGGDDLQEMEAIVLESLPGGKSSLMEWHGLFGLGVLKAKRVQFDLKNGWFGWER